MIPVWLEGNFYNLDNICSAEFVGEKAALYFVNKRMAEITTKQGIDFLKEDLKKLDKSLPKVISDSWYSQEAKEFIEFMTDFFGLSLTEHFEFFVSEFDNFDPKRIVEMVRIYHQEKIIAQEEKDRKGENR